MPAKFPAALVDNAIKLIACGQTVKSAAATLNVGRDALSKAIRARGVEIPRPVRTGKYSKELPDELIIAEYEAGISELELSKCYNATRSSIRARLVNSGVKIRGQSQANIVSMAQMTFEQRQQRAKSANNALRGAKQSRDGRIKRSVGLESSTYEQMVGFGEKEFTEYLTQRAINFTWQKSVNIYSIDFVIGHVAVEFKSGAATLGSRDVARNRIKDIFEAGYTTLYISFRTVDDLVANFDYIITNINVLNRNPPSAGKYWVIRSRIDNFTRCRNELGQFTCVPSPPKLFTSCREFNY